MTTIIQEGLSIAVAGLLITFLSLGLFSLLIYVLGIIFKPKDEAPAKVENVEVQPQPAAVEEADTDLLAVIAAAVAYCRSKTYSQLGASLDEGKGNWWMVNRQRSQQGLGIRIVRSNRG